MLIARSVHPLPGEAERKERLLALVDGFSSRRVLVVGDLIADEFIYGDVGGGAGNAANNVAALGGRARVAGIVGADSEGRRLVASFQRGVERQHIIRSRAYRTPVKTRILAGGIHAARQQIVRIDRETGWPLDDAISAALAARIEPAVDGCDAVLLSDYGSGLVTPTLAAAVQRAVAKRARRRRIPVLLDSRYRLLDYRGVTVCTPNESEVEQLLGITIGDDAATLEKAGRALLKRVGSEAVLITRGSRGMALFEPKRPTVHVPIFGSDEVADVTGAGDTVIATVALALAAGASFYEATRLANYAGGLVVMKRGTATIAATELASAVDSDHDTSLENW